MNSVKNFLIDNWKGILLVTLLLLGTLILGNIPAWKRLWDEQPKVDQIDTPLALHKVDSIRDKNDKLYAKLEEKVYTQAQVNHLLDSVAKVLGIKVKYIQGAERITIKVDTVIKNIPSTPVIVEHNKDTAFRIERHDGWNDIVATAGPDSGSIVFRSRDTITRLEVVKVPLIGPTERYVYINHANPYVKVDQGASFKIKEKQPWLSVGPYIGYDPFQNKASIGVGITFPIINFKR